MKFSVVVVDDEKIIARNIARTIEESNPSFEVTQICLSGIDAWDYIQEHIPHAVFTDIRMPEMDGIELVKKIHEKYPFMMCVIVSGYNDFEYAKSAITYQAADYLLKPINRDEMKRALQEIENRILAQFPNLTTATDAKDSERTASETVELVKEYLRSNYMQAIDLSSLSKNLGFSPSYLVKIFSKHEGITPSKYLKDYRINIAKQLLNDQTLSIASIAEQTGFADQFHFSKSFKAETGISPTEYRKN